MTRRTAQPLWLCLLVALVASTGRTAVTAADPTNDMLVAAAAATAGAEVTAASDGTNFTDVSAAASSAPAGGADLNTTDPAAAASLPAPAGASAGSSDVVVQPLGALQPANAQKQALREFFKHLHRLS